MTEGNPIHQKTKDAINLISQLISDKEKKSLLISSGKNTITFEDRMLKKYGHLYPCESTRKIKSITLETVKKYKFAFEDEKLVIEREKFIDELGNKLFKSKKEVIMKKFIKFISIFLKILVSLPTAVAFISRFIANK